MGGKRVGTDAPQREEGGHRRDEEGTLPSEGLFGGHVDEKGACDSHLNCHQITRRWGGNVIRRPGSSGHKLETCIIVATSKSEETSLVMSSGKTGGMELMRGRVGNTIPSGVEATTGS